MISAAQWPRPISIPQARVPAQAVPKSGPARRVLWNGSAVEPERLAHSCVGGIEPGGEIFVLEGAAEPWGILRRGRELSDCVLGARAIVQQPQVLRMLREGTIEVFQCVPVALHPVIELSAAEAELPEIRRRETAIVGRERAGSVPPTLQHVARVPCRKSGQDAEPRVDRGQWLGLARAQQARGRSRPSGEPGYIPVAPAA